MNDFDIDYFVEFHLSISEFEKSGKSTHTSDQLLSDSHKYISYKVFNTGPHKCVFRNLFNKAINLYNGGFVNKVGVGSSTLVGAKGIGKSSAMKAFCKLVKYAVPNVTAIYISFNNIVLDNSELATHTLLEIIYKLLGFGEEIMQPGENSKGHMLLRLLREKDMHLLLVVDEIDQLYRMTSPIDGPIIKTLHALAFFGNQSSGRIAVCLCGSSAHIEDLITCNAKQSDRLVREFPLCESGIPNLNGTKYRTVRVPSVLPNDLKALAIICDDELTDQNRGWFRLLAFYSGCSARKVQSILGSMSLGSDLDAVSPTSVLNGMNTLGNAICSNLRKAILKKCYEKNKTLCDAMFSKRNDMAIINEISNREWEDRFVPLSYADVEELWVGLIKTGTVKEEQSGELLYFVLHLSDRCLITWDRVVDCKPHIVYPFSLCSLMDECALESSLKEAVTDTIARLISQGVASTGRTLSNPYVVAQGGLAAVAATGACCVLM